MTSQNTTDSEPQRYVSAARICELFEIGLRTVRRLQAQGILKEHRMGPRLIRFKLDEVEAALFSR